MRGTLQRREHVQLFLTFSGEDTRIHSVDDEPRDESQGCDETFRTTEVGIKILEKK